jgi:hypothetical protein
MHSRFKKIKQQIANIKNNLVLTPDITRILIHKIKIIQNNISHNVFLILTAAERYVILVRRVFSSFIFISYKLSIAFLRYI